MTKLKDLYPSTYASNILTRLVLVNQSMNIKIGPKNKKQTAIPHIRDISKKKQNSCNQLFIYIALKKVILNITKTLCCHRQLECKAKN